MSRSSCCSAGVEAKDFKDAPTKISSGEVVVIKVVVHEQGVGGNSQMPATAK